MKVEGSPLRLKAEDQASLPSTPKKRRSSTAPSAPSSPHGKGYSFEDKYRFVLYLLASYGHKTLSADHKVGLSALLGRTEHAISRFHLNVIKIDMQTIIQEMDTIIDENN